MSFSFPSITSVVKVWLNIGSENYFVRVRKVNIVRIAGKKNVDCGYQMEHGE